ncbi:hypothetical protein Tco_0104905 [Tanacetum coccineum]
MLTDPTNQIPGSSSNPGGSTQPSFTQMPYYPNFQPQYSNQEEQMLFHQFKMQMQMNKQQQSNQFTTSQPHSEQQSHHLVDETEEEEEEPLPTPTSKPNRGCKKSVAKKQKVAEDMTVLQIDTSGMDLTYAAIINAQKERIRAEYLPPN